MKEDFKVKEIDSNEEYDETQYHVSATCYGDKDEVYIIPKYLLRKHKFINDVMSGFRSQCSICDYCKEGGVVDVQKKEEHERLVYNKKSPLDPSIKKNITDPYTILIWASGVLMIICFLIFIFQGGR